MRNPFVYTLKAAFVVTLFGCFGGTTTQPASQYSGLGTVRGVAGDNVTLLGEHLVAGGTPTVTMNGLPCDIVSVGDNGVVIRVPPAAATGWVTVDNEDGSWTLGMFFVGPTAPVPEVEPNDDVNGGNATSDMGNRAGTGTLASSADADHFRFENVHPTKHYTLNVSPRLVDVVYVNGIEFALDASGNADVYVSGAETYLVGLTGASGNYSVTLTLVP